MSLTQRNSASSLPQVLIDQLQGKSILVSGATGLIGINILASLAHAVATKGLKLQIHGISRTGVLPAEFPFPSLVRVWREDLLSHQLSFGSDQFDLVVHGATYAQPAKFMANPMETILLNTQGTSSLLSSTRERFLFVSSSEVYSGLEGGPFREEQIGTTTPAHPRSPYIEGKRAGEAMVLSDKHDGRLSAVARLSLAYGPGPRADDQRVLNELVIRGISEGAVTLRGGGESLRSYIFVDDAVLYLLGILLLGNRDVYNVGGLNTISLHELGLLISNALEVPFVDQSTSPLVPGAPLLVKTDMTKTKALIPFVAETRLEVGLEETIAWFRRILVNNQTR